MALNATSIVPASGSTATASQPSVSATAGRRARPASTSQNGPLRPAGTVTGPPGPAAAVGSVGSPWARRVAGSSGTTCQQHTEPPTTSASQMSVRRLSSSSGSPRCEPVV